MTNSVSRTISDATLSRIIQIESGGRPNIKAGTSSATGLGQFLDATWLATVKKYRPDLMKNRTRSQVLALRLNPSTSIEMLARFTEDNARQLGRGYEDGDLYLAHFSGVGVARKLLRATAGDPVSNYYSSAAIRANRSVLAGKTVGQVRAWAAKRMAQSGATNWVARYWTGKAPAAPVAVAALEEEIKTVELDEVSSAARAGAAGEIGGEATALEPAVDPVTAEPRPAVAMQGDPALWNVQRRLEAMGYNPGGLDGKWGVATSGAIAGFISGRKLPLISPTSLDMFHDSQEELKAELGKAEADSHKRKIVPERQFADDKTVEAAAPEIKPVKQGKLAAIWAAIVSFFGMIFNALIEYFRDAMELAANIKDAVPTEVFFAAVIGLCVFFAWKAGSGANGISNAFKSGERL